MKRIFFAAILGALLALTLYGQKSDARKTPAIKLKNLAGKTVRLSDFKGKVVLLNFWAEWCVPCAAEIPDLVKRQQEYAGKGLQILGITYPPTSRSKVRRFVRKYRINYPVLLGLADTKKLFEPTETLPVTVIIDRHGKVVGLIEGIMYADEFEAKIKPLLK